MIDITHYRNIANNKYSHENELASALNECLDEIERLRVGVPEGWVLVPKEPTKAQYDAARDCTPVDKYKAPDSLRTAYSIYSCMLSAAPTPPAEEAPYRIVAIDQEQVARLQKGERVELSQRVIVIPHSEPPK